MAATMSVRAPFTTACAGKAAAAPRAAALVRSVRVQQRAPMRGRRVCVAEVDEDAPPFVPEFENKEFQRMTLEAFPDKAIANAEEGRVLFSLGGYTYLDVRPALELDLVGKVKGCVNIPIVNSKQVYNPETKKKDIIKEDNPDFIKMVRKRFPNPETAKLMVACSDGTTYSIDALEALDEAGYVNIVGLKGGFYNWYRTWDANLRRRRSGEYAEQYTHDGDSCGIHSSGAGFDRVDAIERWVPPKL